MIVKARGKRFSELALSIGWHGELFARTKRLLPLHKYLEPASAGPRNPDKGAKELREMIQRMHKRQEAKRGAR